MIMEFLLVLLFISIIILKNKTFLINKSRYVFILLLYYKEILNDLILNKILKRCSIKTKKRRQILCLFMGLGFLLVPLLLQSGIIQQTVFHEQYFNSFDEIENLNVAQTEVMKKILHGNFWFVILGGCMIFGAILLSGVVSNWIYDGRS